MANRFAGDSLFRGAVRAPWAGVLQWLIIGGLLVRGYALPLSRKRLTEFLANVRSGPWAAVLVSFVVTTGTFLIVRQTLKLNHEETLQAADAVGGLTINSCKVPMRKPSTFSMESRTSR